MGTKSSTAASASEQSVNTRAERLSTERIAAKSSALDVHASYGSLGQSDFKNLKIRAKRAGQHQGAEGEHREQHRRTRRLEAKPRCAPGLP